MANESDPRIAQGAREDTQLGLPLVTRASVDCGAETSVSLEAAAVDAAAAYGSASDSAEATGAGPSASPDQGGSSRRARFPRDVDDLGWRRGDCRRDRQDRGTNAFRVRSRAKLRRHPAIAALINTEVGSAAPRQAVRDRHVKGNRNLTGRRPRCLEQTAVYSRDPGLLLNSRRRDEPVWFDVEMALLI